MNSVFNRIKRVLLVITTGCATACQNSTACDGRSHRERAYELIDKMVESHCEELKKIVASRSPEDMWEFGRRIEKCSNDFKDKVTGITLGVDSIVRLEKKLAKGVDQ